MNKHRVAELAALKQGSGLEADDLRALDIVCSHILGKPPIDRTVPAVCPCHLCTAKATRTHREPRTASYTGTLRERRLARLVALGFR